MNKLIACGLLLAISAINISSAYNFEDSAYNEVLARDLEEFETETVAVHPRARRDEEAASGSSDKCKRKRSKFCCAEETLEMIHDMEKPLKKECYKQITGKDKHSGYHGHNDPFKCDKDKVERHRREMTCVMQCVGQKKDVLDAEGNIKEEAIKTQMKEKFAKEEWLAPKLNEILDRCITEAKQVPVKVEAEGKEAACNTTGMKFGHCFWRELQFSCPADQIKDQRACEKVKEKIKNYSDSYPFTSRNTMEED
ncbi:PREDICTED: uncharacterized protein LOC108569950 [Nicrophorus vespilloides]|uniref:Uncharacterized protein LOC108569950 n=1 Tax=Nicrophorus vespilloides TaxID=110193 RepID=A0ABM1NK76_NICVS|nr:PREDICTED: uncharacterized protein LOC108569950 [Nicrophorus vespilloides]